MYGCGFGSGIRMGWEVFSQNTQFEIGVVGKYLAKILNLRLVWEIE